MSRAIDINQAISSDSSTAANSDDGCPLEWCMEASGDYLQGPLEMEFLRDKKIFLNLDPGQVALLATGDELRAIYLEGGHILEVGTYPGQTDPLSSLIFLATDHLLELRWTHGSPIDLPGPQKRHVIGNCSLAIARPAEFYYHFVQAADEMDAKTLLDAVEKECRNNLTEYLNAVCSGGLAAPAGLQTTLMNLQAETLSEELSGLGLSCTHLALYTANPPVEDWADEPAHEETAGQSLQLVQ